MTKRIDSEIIDVLLLENVKEQKRNTIGSVKLNKILHSGIFKEHVYFKFVVFTSYASLMFSRIISFYVEMTILFAYEVRLRESTKKDQIIENNVA